MDTRETIIMKWKIEKKWSGKPEFEIVFYILFGPFLLIGFIIYFLFLGVYDLIFKKENDKKIK